MACENHIILYPIFPHFQNIFLGILGFILDESLDLLLGCVQAFFLFHLQLYFEQEVSYFQRLCWFGVVLSLHKLSSSTCERRLGRQLLVKALIVLRVESFPSFTIFLSVIPESQFCCLSIDRDALLGRSSPRGILRPMESASPGNLQDMQIQRTCTKPTEQDTVGWDQKSEFNKTPWLISVLLKFENPHCRVNRKLPLSLQRNNFRSFFWSF